MGNLQAATRALEQGLKISYSAALRLIQRESGSPTENVRDTAARILEKQGKPVPPELRRVPQKRPAGPTPPPRRTP